MKSGGGVGWSGPDGYLRPVQFLDHLTVITINIVPAVLSDEWIRSE